MKELVELQNVRLSEREKLMSSAFNGSSLQQLEMQKKYLSWLYSSQKDCLLVLKYAMSLMPLRMYYWGS